MVPAADAIEDVDVLLSQNYLLQQRLDEMKNELSTVLASHMRYMVTMNATLRRISAQPFRRAVASSPPSNPSHDSPSNRDLTGDNQTNDREQTIHLKLSKSPPDLFVLWDEYEKGLNGQKAARDYTPAERGANKHTYSLRNVFWGAVECFIRRGQTSDTAIDRILSVYGRDKSVTAVLKAMKRDRGRNIV